MNNNEPNNIQKIIANLPRYAGNWSRWLVWLGETPPDQVIRKQDSPQQEETISKPPPPLPSTRYVISSMFLHRCYRYLNRRPVEDLHLVAGFKNEGYFIMNDMVTLENIKGSLGGASADILNTRQGLLHVEKFGHKCCAMFHIHPGNGLHSTHPSSTDWDNQKTWEAAYPLVGGIFSRDGCLRFYRLNSGFHIMVHGMKVKKIDENLYQLETD